MRICGKVFQVKFGTQVRESFRIFTRKSAPEKESSQNCDCSGNRHAKPRMRSGLVQRRRVKLNLKHAACGMQLLEALGSNGTVSKRCARRSARLAVCQCCRKRRWYCCHHSHTSLSTHAGMLTPSACSCLYKTALGPYKVNSGFISRPLHVSCQLVRGLVLSV